MHKHIFNCCVEQEVCSRWIGLLSYPVKFLSALQVNSHNASVFYRQISTGTGIMSHFVDLHIVVPEAFILGSGEHHVDVGSGISLVCIIEKVRLWFVY